jgi:hypothetical protein
MEANYDGMGMTPQIRYRTPHLLNMVSGTLFVEDFVDALQECRYVIAFEKFLLLFEIDG